VKHPGGADGELVRLLTSLLADIGVPLSAPKAERAIAFLLEVLAANESVNLTRICDPAIAVRLHVLDSLTVTPELNAAPPGRLLDLGTGGGFPGVPLGIASGRDTLLADSVQKKAEAAGRSALAVGVENVSWVASRAEDLAREVPGQFAAVVARAVAPLPALVELAAPLLIDGGLLIALKGAPESDEIEAGDRVSRIVGLRRTGTREFTLPVGGERRVVLVYERSGDSGVPLPRRTGLAQRRPLG
jgi:16S rRNA (guanine527-N7)-methyltransferase